MTLHNHFWIFFLFELIRQSLATQRDGRGGIDGRPFPFFPFTDCCSLRFFCVVLIFDLCGRYFMCGIIQPWSCRLQAQRETVTATLLFFFACDSPLRPRRMHSSSLLHFHFSACAETCFRFSLPFFVLLFFFFASFPTSLSSCSRVW